MNFIKVIKNKYFYSSLILFLILLVFEDTTLFKLYDMKKELNHMVEQNELKSLEINQVKEKTLQLTTNKEALEKTITTKEAHYYSRSRNCLWHKGATSGLIQDVKNIFIDDDQDCIWLNVTVRGEASCHVGYKSCFYREIDTNSKQLELKFVEDEKLFDPEEVYGDAPNPTIL